MCARDAARSWKRTQRAESGTRDTTGAGRKAHTHTQLRHRQEARRPRRAGARTPSGTTHRVPRRPARTVQDDPEDGEPASKRAVVTLRRANTSAETPTSCSLRVSVMLLNNTHHAHVRMMCAAGWHDFPRHRSWGHPCNITEDAASNNSARSPPCLSCHLSADRREASGQAADAFRDPCRP